METSVDDGFDPNDLQPIRWVQAAGDLEFPRPDPRIVEHGHLGIVKAEPVQTSGLIQQGANRGFGGTLDGYLRLGAGFDADQPSPDLDCVRPNFQGRQEEKKAQGDRGQC